PISEAAGLVSLQTGEMDALKIGIQTEKNDVAAYSRAARESPEPEAREMFSYLAKEEQGHQDLLESEHEWLRRSGEYFTLHRFNLPGRS
ncbi:MAG: ferritin family protein, partial [Chloroflexota bacterium]|nr:ferritin family protein [Chloroflexota bacterium]